MAKAAPVRVVRHVHEKGGERGVDSDGGGGRDDTAQAPTRKAAGARLGQLTCTSASSCGSDTGLVTHSRSLLSTSPAPNRSIDLGNTVRGAAMLDGAWQQHTPWQSPHAHSHRQ